MTRSKTMSAVMGASVGLVLGLVPAGAEEVIIDKRNDSSVSGAIIMKDHDTTGSIDRDCVKSKTETEDLATGEKETRIEKRCD